MSRTQITINPAIINECKELGLNYKFYAELGLLAAIRDFKRGKELNGDQTFKLNLNINPYNKPKEEKKDGQ